MGIMNFNNVEASGESTLDGCDPSLLEVLDVGFGHFDRFGVFLIPGNGTRGVYLIRPATDLSQKISIPIIQGLIWFGHTSSFAMAPELNHGATVLAFLPAWASCIPIFWFWLCANSTIRFNGAICESFHKPESSGVILPSAVTDVASIMARPGPRWIIPPRCVMCHAV